MKRISAWFDRHPKTRIALQLALDGLPFLMLAVPFAVSVLPSSKWRSHVTNFNMTIWMYGGGAVLFLLGIWLRRRGEKAFGGYPKCQTISDVLRVMSAIPAFVSFLSLAGHVLMYFGLL